MEHRLVVRLIAIAVAAVFVGLCFVAALIYRNIFGVRIWTRFLAQTGYRRAAAPNEPIEVQAKAILGEIFRPEGVVRGPWVRDVEGQKLTYNSWMYSDGNANVTQESWQLEMPAELTSQVQLLERRLAQPGSLRTLVNAALGRDRRWGEMLPCEVLTGDAAFDARFQVRVSQHNAIPRFLLDPTVRQWISSLPEVCLVFAQRWIVLDDPAGALRRAYVGLSAVTPAQMMEKEPMAHEQVAQTLALLSRAARTA